MVFIGVPSVFIGVPSVFIGVRLVFIGVPLVSCFRLDRPGPAFNYVDSL